MKKLISIKTFMFLICCTMSSLNVYSNELLSSHVTQRSAIDEKKLNASFKNIRSSLNKLNTSIEKLSQEKFVNETEIEKLKTELADTQILSNAAIAQQRAQYKYNNRQEHAINKAIGKAQKKLKALRKKTIQHFMHQTDRIIMQAMRDEL